MAEGHRLVVYVPMELRDQLRRLALQRSEGQKGYMSIGAVVRDLLEEHLGDGTNGSGNKAMRRAKHAWNSELAPQVSNQQDTSATSSVLTPVVVVAVRQRKLQGSEAA